MIVSGDDLISVTLLASSNTLILFVFIDSISAEKEGRKRFLFGRKELNLLMITSESSITERFSLEFILRRFDGDAPPSTVIDTELVRLAVGVKRIGLIVVCC